MAQFPLKICPAGGRATYSVRGFGEVGFVTELRTPHFPLQLVDYHKEDECDNLGCPPRCYVIMRYNTNEYREIMRYNTNEYREIMDIIIPEGEN